MLKAFLDTNILMGELSTCIFLANAELPDRLFHPRWNSHVFRELSHHLHEHIDAKDKAARSSSATRSQIGPTLFRSTRISADTALLGACTLNHAVCRSKSRVYALLRLAHGPIATVTPCSAQSTLRGACSSRSLVQPMSRCRQRRTPRRSYGRPRSRIWRTDPCRPRKGGPERPRRWRAG